MKRVAFRGWIQLSLLAALLCFAGVAQAQTTGGGGTSGGDSTVNGDIINNNFFPNGVIVDASGVLRTQKLTDNAGKVGRERFLAARDKFKNLDVGKPSKLRMVSLNRLDAAIKARLENQLPLTEEMQALAGLTRIQYVFYYPETKDIVIAGPAEPWVDDLAGRPVGMVSGRPALELCDLVAALRAFRPAKKATNVIMCSIDPTQEGLQRMQEFLRSIGSVNPNASASEIVEGLRTSMGMQNIRVAGVPANTHFAQVLVEADYRMKLIGIGMEKPPVRMVVYVDRANPATISRNALQRWFFVPNYECVRVTEDQLGMEMVGEGVQLVDEAQVVSGDGSRATTQKPNKASEAFVKSFTEKYSLIAAKAPVFARLRNCVDLAVAAAFIQQQDYCGKAGWDLGALGDEHSVAVETENAPVQVETTVTALWKNNRLVTPVSGGVHIEPRQAISASNVLSDKHGEVRATREKISAKSLAEDQWWWD